MKDDGMSDEQQRVHIEPLEAWMRGLKYRPSHPPTFPRGEPTRDDIELALALFEALDPESQEWYGGNAFAHSLRARLKA